MKKIIFFSLVLMGCFDIGRSTYAASHEEGTQDSRVGFVKEREESSLSLLSLHQVPSEQGLEKSTVNFLRPSEIACLNDHFLVPNKAVFQKVDTILSLIDQGRDIPSLLESFRLPLEEGARLDYFPSLYGLGMWHQKKGQSWHCLRILSNGFRKKLGTRSKDAI